MTLMKKGIWKVLLALLFTGAISMGIFHSQAWAIGYFSKSCTNSEMISSFLLSSCSRKNGITNKTWIDLNKYISNDDGLLKWKNDDGFIESCEGIRLSSSLATKHTEMNADCEIEGYLVENNIDLDEHITNIDGQLEYN